MKFTPYANEADVLQLGRLSIENRLDRVTLCGDLDLTRDQSGLVHARLLHKLLGEIVARLEAQPLPETLPAPQRKQVDNPFN
ncbi:MAG: hypothetical protein V4463_13010 [Pseudomonadota bacterium]